MRRPPGPAPGQTRARGRKRRTARCRRPTGVSALGYTEPINAKYGLAR